MSEKNREDKKNQIQGWKKWILYGAVLLMLISLPLDCYLAYHVVQLKSQMQNLRRELDRSYVADAENAALALQAFSEGAANEGWQESAEGLTLPSGFAAEDHMTGEAMTEEDAVRAWEDGGSKFQEAEGGQQTDDGIRRVYLTFDDGPSIYTDDILDILKQYNVKATFFVVAKGKSVYEDQYRRIVEEGHTLGMHSYSHIYREVYSSKEAFVKDVNRLQDYLHEVTDTYPSVYRFPGGSSNRVGKTDMKELKAYLDEIGLTWYDWNISSKDATGKLSKDQVVRNCTAGLTKYQNAIILLHDAADKRSTVDALPEIIETILKMDDTILVPITADTVPVQHS